MYSQRLLLFCQESYDGYDVYGVYGQKVLRTFTDLKDLGKCIIVLNHDQRLESASGKVERVSKVEGKMLLGTLESHALISLHAVTRPNDQGEEEYMFLTNTDGERKAKSPIGMFPKYIPNDLKLVIDGIVNYYNNDSEEGE